MILGNTHFGWALNQLFDGREVFLPEWAECVLRLDQDQKTIWMVIDGDEPIRWSPTHAQLLSRDWQSHGTSKKPLDKVSIE